MTDLVLIAEPAVEPVTLSDLKLELGLSPVEDTDHVKEQMLAKKLRRYLRTARLDCENRTRRAFITQTWQMKMDGFPRPDPRYTGHWERRPILLPLQPFQAIVSVQYVDTTGTLVALPQDTTYGNTGTPAYAYQLDPGSAGQPARIAPAWLRPWPPTRIVQSNVQIQFTCGYGDTGAAVPDSITQAILFLARSYYDPSAFKNVDGLVNNLLGPYVNRVS